MTQCGPVFAHQTPAVCRLRNVATEDAVLTVQTEFEQLAFLRDRGKILGQFARHVKLFGVHFIAARDFGEQLLNVGQVEACDFQIELRIGSQLRQQAGEFVIIPLTCDLVQGDVECLLLVQGKIDDADVDLLVPPPCATRTLKRWCPPTRLPVRWFQTNGSTQPNSSRLRTRRRYSASSGFKSFLGL